MPTPRRFRFATPFELEIGASIHESSFLTCNKSVASAVDDTTADGASFSSQGCDPCHNAGNGDMGPALHRICSKLLRDQMTEGVKNGKPNTAMPALPPGATDQRVEQIVDYLASSQVIGRTLGPDAFGNRISRSLLW